MEHCGSRDDSPQLESEPCEAGRNNPSRRHASTSLRMEEARLEAVSVGGGTGSGDQSRDVSYRTPGPLGERPMVPGGRERTQREDELQRQVEDDSAQGPVVRAKRPSSAPSMDEWDGHLAAGHAEYRGWCPFCVAGKGKSETHRRMEASRDHGHPELRLDYAYMVRWFERPKLERHQSWLESSRRIVGCSLIPCRARAHTTSMDCWQARERCDHERRADHGDQMRSGSVNLGRGECSYERVEEH